ncbi:MAG: zinc-binding dehydrogenase, partial [Hyphococcus sp.]
ELFSFYKEGKIRPQITSSFPLEQAAEALVLLEQRKATGKIVLAMDN